jgi:hypothetical protein
MANTKSLNIIVDKSSWSKSRPPEEVMDLNGGAAVSLEQALLQTALWTRPPHYTGCDLSDCWAWLRYQRAFAPGCDLRLCKDWDEISSQQKAVLSEELSVGVATQVLTERLGFLLFVETKALVNLLGTKLLKLGRTTKKGPKKAPDYLALDSHLEFSALECKGNQSSLKELQRAIETGIKQKQNLSPSEGNQLKHSLVAGLFLPQARSKEAATLQISDPTWEEMLPLFTEIPFRDLLAAVVQLALAKHFALLGCHALANVLAVADLAEQKRALFETRKQLAYPVKRRREQLCLVVEYPLSLQAMRAPQESLFPDERVQTRRVRFQMSCALELYERLTRSATPEEEIFQLASKLEGAQWEAQGDEFNTRLRSPLGFDLVLEYRN